MADPVWVVYGAHSIDAGQDRIPVSQPLKQPLHTLQTAFVTPSSVPLQHLWGDVSWGCGVNATIVLPVSSVQWALPVKVVDGRVT